VARVLRQVEHDLARLPGCRSTSYNSAPDAKPLSS
jgi:hypothetical protein